MTPMEERKSKFREEEIANKARKKVMDEVLEMALAKMPEGHVKRCGQILQKTGRVHDLLCTLDTAAAKTETLDEKTSQQILDYITCVHVGMTQFMQQIGMEVQ